MKYLMLAIVMALGACATGGPSSRTSDELRASLAQYRAGLAADPSLAVLWGKTAILPDETTFDMLTINGKVSEDEKGPLRAYAVKNADYSQHMLAVFRRDGIDPQIISIWEGATAANDNLRAILHNGDITWGQYNQRRKEINVALKRALADTQAAINQRNQQAAYQAAALFQQSYSNALLVQAMQPRSTVCNRIGNAIYCN